MHKPSKITLRRATIATDTQAASASECGMFPWRVRRWDLEDIVGVLERSSRLSHMVEGNMNKSVGKMLIVVVGYSVGPKDAGTPGPLLGRLNSVAMGVPVNIGFRLLMAEERAAKMR